MGLGHSKASTVVATPSRVVNLSGTLVIYSGPTDAREHSAKSRLYHDNLESFLALGVAPHHHPLVTTAIVLTSRLAHLEPKARARGALVYYRRNVCYDMESARIVLADMRKRARRYNFYIMLNCGMFGPTLPAYLLQAAHAPHWSKLLTSTLNARVKLVGMVMCCGGVGGRSHPHLDSSLWATDAQGLSWIEEDDCIFECAQDDEGPTPEKVVVDIIKKYEMGMSLAITRRGYHLDALNLLQRGVDWRDGSNAEGCKQRTRTCYYDEDYPYGPPDLMFTKLSAVEFVPGQSTYSRLGGLYNATWRATDAYRELYGFVADPAPAAHDHGVATKRRLSNDHGVATKRRLSTMNVPSSSTVDISGFLAAMRDHGCDRLAFARIGHAKTERDRRCDQVLLPAAASIGFPNLLRGLDSEAKLKAEGFQANKWVHRLGELAMQLAHGCHRVPPAKWAETPGCRALSTSLPAPATTATAGVMLMRAAHSSREVEKKGLEDLSREEEKGLDDLPCMRAMRDVGVHRMNHHPVHAAMWSALLEHANLTLAWHVHRACAGRYRTEDFHLYLDACHGVGHALSWLCEVELYDGFGGAFVLDDEDFLRALGHVPMDEALGAAAGMLASPQREHIERLVGKLDAHMRHVEDSRERRERDPPTV